MAEETALSPPRPHLHAATPFFFSFFPCQMNAYAIHGSGDKRTYNALYPAKGDFDQPDLYVCRAAGHPLFLARPLALSLSLFQLGSDFLQPHPLLPPPPRSHRLLFFEELNLEGTATPEEPWVGQKQ